MPAERLARSARLYAALCTIVLVAKTHALLAGHQIWWDKGLLYTAAAGAAASWREFLAALAICAVHYAAGGIGRARSSLRTTLHALVATASVLLVLINLVNAELLPKLGMPLTLPLIHFSDVLWSEHGRRALWAWADAGTLRLALGAVAAALLAWLLAGLAFARFGTRIAAALFMAGTAAAVVAGTWRSPVPPNYERSATVAFLRSLGPSGLGAGSGPDAAAPFELGAGTAGISHPRAQGGEIRNVVLIVLEAAAIAYLEPYGGNQGAMPRLAARAGQSVVVRNAYAQSLSSTASLAVLLSSRYPPVAPRSLPATLGGSAPPPLLPRLLADAGMRTGFFHSSDTRFHGAETFLRAGGYGTVRDFRGRPCEDELLRDAYSSLGTSDSCTFEQMTRWIEEQDPRPFFATLWTFQSHYPYFSRAPIDPGGAASPNPRVRAQQARYLGALAEADALIDRLIRRLEALGLDRTTLIVVTSDHGQAFGERGSFGNGASLHEESVRVPLILIHPDAGPVRSTDRIGGHIDVAPTIADALGLAWPDSWEGYSLYRPAPDRPIYFTSFAGDLAIGYRLGSAKTMVDFGTGTAQVYDLDADPRERNDLAPSLPPERLRGEGDWVAAWARRINARWSGEAAANRSR